MNEDKLKKLSQELSFFVEDERNKILSEYANKVDNNVNITELAKQIYLERGIDYSKLNRGIINNLTSAINELIYLFKSKEKATKKKMVIEILYIVVLLILIKVPFNLVRDIGFDYIEILSTNSLINTLWNLIFLIIYTITIICTFVVSIRIFNNKYRNMK